MTRSQFAFPCLLAMAFAGASAGPAAAQQMLSPSAEGLRQIAAEFGPARLVPPSRDYSDPYIDAEAAGYYYLLILIGCDQSMANCDQVELSASFTVREPDLDFLNDWNTGNRIGTAYVEDGVTDEILLSYTVLLDPPLTVANFRQVLSFWSEIMSDFSGAIFQHEDGGRTGGRVK